ncbi:hypothetical protein NQ317_011615 [Molorchus minor]|uniref:Uncharacterized protein n=1 Tax=Molorchus minor TaxID=1323400 RepID=A0ABQ9J7X7_9CUCU|nr:hypothetical protein NQ317_011615 [Molorchus minor]
MLSSLKEKILNVTQNVPLFNLEEKDPTTKGTINVNAGADILKHFQDQWEELHNINEENARCANQVGQEIDTITSKISADKENICLITHILSNSNLSGNISNYLSTIKDLYKTSEAVEKQLIQLECLIEETEFKNLKIQHQYHLQQYRFAKGRIIEEF